jgi:hypothetical protein
MPTVKALSPSCNRRPPGGRSNPATICPRTWQEMITTLKHDAKLFFLFFFILPICLTLYVTFWTNLASAAIVVSLYSWLPSWLCSEKWEGWWWCKDELHFRCGCCWRHCRCFTPLCLGGVLLHTVGVWESLAWLLSTTNFLEDLDLRRVRRN